MSCAGGHLYTSAQGTTADWGVDAEGRHMRAAKLAPLASERLAGRSGSIRDRYVKVWPLAGEARSSLTTGIRRQDRQGK